MGEKSIVKLTLGKGDQLFLKSLFPIEWTEFISEGVWYNGVAEARTKLNERHYQLSISLQEMEASVERIDILTYHDGKLQSTTKYIGG